MRVCLEHIVQTKMKSKNNAGVIDVVVVVMLFFALVVSSLFVFSMSFSKAKVKIYDYQFIDGFYAKEKIAKYYILDAGQKAKKKIKTFSDKDAVRINFISYFKTIFSNYSFDEDYLIELQNSVEKDNFEVVVDDEKIIINVYMEISGSTRSLKIIYRPVIIEEFYLD